jgi:M6 family metalloprotease-like protein/uncharacterized repeat protein (TIGR01451 family)
MKSMLKRQSIAHVLLSIVICLFSAASGGSYASPASIHQSDVTLNQFTQQLLVASELANKGQGSAAHVEQVAKQRLSALLNIINTQPESVLRVAFSQQVYDATAISAKPFVEQPVQNISGTFQALCAVGADAAETRFYLKTDDGHDYVLNFIKQNQKLPQTGTKIVIPFAIKFPGMGGEDHLLVPDDLKTPSLIIKTAVPQWPTTGVFKTLAILVNFADAPTNQPFSVADVKNTLAQNVSGFFYENSSHLTTMQVDATGWYTTTFKSTDQCDSIYINLLNAAKTLAKSGGFDSSLYDRLVIVFPRSSNCGWLGLGWIGGGKAYGQTWINGTPTQQVMGHELGHNFSLYHSHSQTCSSGPVGGTCTNSEYGDSADTMGNKTASHFNAAQKESLGWLDASNLPAITTVTSSGVYKIEPFESFTYGVKAIRVPKTSPVTATSEYYYVEYRQPIGYDTVLSGNLTKGVLIRRGLRGGTGSGSYLLNMVPTDGSFFSAALTPGNTFTDTAAPNNGVNITLNSADASGATVAVNFGAAPVCVRANPSLTVTPTTTQWVQPGKGFTYTLTLINQDSAACSNSTFNVSTSAVTGVTNTLSASSVSVAPGASTTITLNMLSALSAADGAYSTVVSAINSVSAANLASVTTTLGVQQICISANPSVSLSPSTQTGKAGDKVTYAVTVANNDNKACAAANFTLASTLPAGLTGMLGQSSLTIAPGATTTVNLDVGSSLTTPASSYAVSVKATNAASTTLTGSGSATYVLTSACVLATPTVIISPTTQSTWGTVPVSYTVKFTNNNSPACGYSLFGFEVAPDSYYLKTFMEPYNLFLIGGQSTTSVMTITPAAGVPEGTRLITLRAKGATAIESASTTTNLQYTIAQPLQVMVTSDKSTYQRTGTLYYANLNVTTTLNGNPVPNVPLLGTLTWPDGHSESLTTNSGSTGTRWFGQDVQMSSQVGTYKMTAVATYAGKQITGLVTFNIN